MDLRDIYDSAKAQAILNTLESNEISVWRSICRHYSSKFSTPLHLCLDGTISPEEILLAVLEDQLGGFDEEKDLENILDQIYSMLDPDYEHGKDNEVKDFIKQAEEQEKERLRLGKPIHKSMRSEPSLDQVDKLSKKNTSEKSLPSSGSVDFSHLQEADDES